MASGGEFDFIRTRLGPLTRNHAAALGLDDDAAVLDPPPGCQLVLACDTLVAGVHFREADAPETAAARAMRSNLSDMAAMGADPIGYLSALTWPREIDSAWRDAFVAGLAAEQDEFAVPLLGGDTTSTPGPMTVTLTLIGTVPQGAALTRVGASPGDDLWVSGPIGDAVLGLAALEGEGGVPRDLARRYERPEPRLALGQALRGLASAAIDISDGLVADAGHIAETSGLALTIEAGAVPLSGPARTWLDTAGPGGLTRLLTGGDDYELLFTAPSGCRDAIAALATEGAPLARIGHAEAGTGVICRDASGAVLDVGRAGFTHF
ncbi:MAG: thiamine-phosphate kinase [Pseudomonadota bacterium]|nr:thiamine-phosphate kinase [Pseudomonadota bacterium]